MSFRQGFSLKIVKAILFNSGVFMASAVQANVCNLDPLYTESFNYPTPKRMIETYLDGKAFDHKVSYNPQERAKLETDINAIYSVICDGAVKSSNLVATMTAGSPGTGKTTVMRQVLENEGSKAAYICPDDVCLKSMSLTYGAELAAGLSELSKHTFASTDEAVAAERKLREDLYTKWRPGSNGATQAILGNLIREKYDIFFGTTSSSPHSGSLFQFFKDRGYKIRILHISAPDSVRWGSIQERDKTFVQTTEQDIREKGDLVPQRILDTYLKYADEIQFFYRDGVAKEAVKAATWVRGNGAEKPTTLTITAHAEYEGIKKVHNAVCDKLGLADPVWEKAVESTSLIR